MRNSWGQPDCIMSTRETPSLGDNEEDELYGLTDSEEDAHLLYAIIESLETAKTTGQTLIHNEANALARSAATSSVSTRQATSVDTLLDETLWCADTPESDHNKITREEILTYENERIKVGQSPYDRFRSKHQRLSVTDLVGPAWCEVQFQYDLEKGGKRRRTKAMKIGHEVHSKLEKEVHTTVVFELDNEIPEEKFGLRLLNILTGLSELEHGGMTRELPVMGFIGDTFVSGIIDQIQVSKSTAPTNEQKALATFLNRKVEIPSASLVLSDHKTRVSRSQPPVSQIDQTKLQLMIYWKLLSHMHLLDIARILSRDALSADRSFSDHFLSQALQNNRATSEDEISNMISHNTIAGLWYLLESRLRKITTQLNSTMIINYLHQGSGESIMAKSFELDPPWMQDRLESIMTWWDGKRDARGVPIEEAYKCSICQFEAGCTWRLTKIQEGIEKHRDQKMARSIKRRLST